MNNVSEACRERYDAGVRLSLGIEPLSSLSDQESSEAVSRDGWSTWLEALSSEREPHETDALRRACEVAAAAHESQKRASGEPYITHPLAVADILQSLRLDVDTLVAAILRDVVEDTPVTLNDLTTPFGSQVTGLVDGGSGRLDTA